MLLRTHAACTPLHRTSQGLNNSAKAGMWRPAGIRPSDAWPVRYGVESHVNDQRPRSEE